MNYEDYRAIPAANWSRLKSLRVSPKQYQHDGTTPREDAAYFRVGRAIHGFLLEPENFERHFVCYRDGARRGKGWEAFKERHASYTILTADEWSRAMGAATALLDHPTAAAYLASGFREAVITWTDDVTGVECKARVDHCGTHLVDIKSTATIERRMFAAAAARLGYHGQLAFYLDGLRANGINVNPTPILLAVQSDAPFDVVPYRLPEHVVQAGRDEYRRLLVLLRECRESGSWPGLAPEGELDLELPEWAFNMSDSAVELTMGGVTLEGL